jgi:polysaccharide biosynthesis protein PslE
MNLNQTPHDYLIVFIHILFKRKRLILTFMACSFALVCLYTFMATPIFMASSQVLVKLGRENVFIPQVGNVSPILNENTVEQINSELELLKSQVLAEAVIKSVGLDKLFPDMQNPGWLGRIRRSLSGTADNRNDERALLRFQKALAVQGVRNSRVIEIEFQHPDRKLAAEVVNRYVATYLDERLKLHRDPQSFAFFDEQTRLLREKIQKAEERLKDLKALNQVIEPGQERDLMLRQKSELEAVVNDTAGRIEETQRRILQLRNQLASLSELVAQGEETEPNQLLINTLQTQMVQLEIRKKELLTKYTDNNPLLLEVNEQLRGVQQRLVEEQSRRYGRSRYGPNPTYQQIREELLRNEVEEKALTAKLAIQREQLDQYRTKLVKIVSSELDLSELQNEIDVDRRNFQLYQTKAEENRISNEMDSRKIANVSVINAALPPIEPIKPNKWLNLGLGVLFAIFGSIGLALGIEVFKDHFERPDEVEAALGSPVLASIPYRQG